MRRASITNEKVLKVWKLHKKGLDATIISETLDISAHSVSRIIRIMTTAQNGGDVDSVEGKGHQNIKDFAKKMFGIKTDEEKLIEKHESNQNSEDDSRDIMLKMLHMLAWQNELLEQLLSELGVDWKTHRKGVERR